MPNEIRLKDIAAATFNITLVSLAAAASRQSTMVTNSSDYPAAIVSLKITSGNVLPTAGALYVAYLLRNDGTISTDAAGASDAAITIENAPLLGTIVVTATAEKGFYGEFDTAPLGPLGPTWGIAVNNATTGALSSAAATHVTDYSYYVPEIQ